MTCAYSKMCKLIVVKQYNIITTLHRHWIWKNKRRALIKINENAFPDEIIWISPTVDWWQSSRWRLTVPSLVYILPSDYMSIRQVSLNNVECIEPHTGPPSESREAQPGDCNAEQRAIHLGVTSRLLMTGYRPVTSHLPLTGYSPVASHLPLTGHSPVASHLPVTGHSPVASHLPVTGYPPVASHMPMTGYPPVLTCQVIERIWQR